MVFIWRVFKKLQYILFINVFYDIRAFSVNWRRSSLFGCNAGTRTAVKYLETNAFALKNLCSYPSCYMEFETDL
jgi:hypothetical protein